jgi:hypothetical protein
MSQDVRFGSEEVRLGRCRVRKQRYEGRQAGRQAGRREGGKQGREPNGKWCDLGNLGQGVKKKGTHHGIDFL